MFCNQLTRWAPLRAATYIATIEISGGSAMATTIRLVAQLQAMRDGPIRKTTDNQWRGPAMQNSQIGWWPRGGPRPRRGTPVPAGAPAADVVKLLAGDDMDLVTPSDQVGGEVAD